MAQLLKSNIAAVFKDMPATPQQARAFFLLSRCSRVHTAHLHARRQGSFCSAAYRSFATATDRRPQKPYYVTSPIFYVNAAPHAGHLYTLVLTDILKRWQRLRGDDRAVLLTGTDEHGMKIQKAAQKAKVDVKAFCDQHATQFEDLAKLANVDYDRFMRTTDSDHRVAVEHFWRELNRKGYIYESKHEGWYSVSDETFYPESKVHLVLEPSSGRKMYASMETGKEVEWTSEVNYHFKLSSFKDSLLQHYRQNPEFIVPSTRMKEMITEIENGLTDLSVSRPATRLTWGIRVPDDPSQTIYVWLDALINYLTMTGYPFATATEATKLWPPNCQVIGKDIIRFHCIYWPAFLMALDLPVPKQFLSHAHWTMNRAKMSKSEGNVVNPFFAINRFGVDVMRYYMAHDGGIVDDADYENLFIVDRYKKDLQGGFGNLVGRVVRGKKWSVPDSVKFAASSPRDLGPEDAFQMAIIDKTAGDCANLMDQLNPRKAVHAVKELIYATNRYMQATAVWDVVAEGTPDAQQATQRIIFVCAESIRVIAILLQPVMPSKMKRALDILGVDESKRSFEYARTYADFTYGTPLVDPGRAGASSTLFPPLMAET